jgi:RNA polymerase sigma factor (sigma-70 family)
MVFDDSLIARCRQQDRKAQEQVYTYFYQDAFRIACRYAKNEDDAKDILNDSFFTVFTKIDQFNGNASNFFAWVKKIIVNKSLDQLRSAAFKNSTVSLDEVQHETITDNQHHDFDYNIIKFIQLLPFTTSSVFNLFVMEGYNHKEISQLLGITEANSKYHLHSARQKLKNMIFKSEIK